MTAQLFSPTTVGQTNVQNRVFMAPLTRNRAHPDGTPHEMAIEYYRQRAGSGLILTEATQISAMGKGYINTPGIYNDKHIEAWKKITDAVHEEGGKIYVQLWHVGRISHRSLLPHNTVPLAPSALQADAQTFTEEGPTQVSEPKAMDINDIIKTVNDYSHAAGCAQKAGFDGVEVHAANGYLIDQFLQDKTNQREDNYGGSADNRVRFLTDVVGAVIDVCGAGCVGVRLSPTGTFNDMSDSNPLQTFGTAIENLKSYGLAYLHMVESFPGIETQNDDTAIMKQLIDQWDGFYIANGDYDRESAIQAIESGHADAITFGRPYISNPDLAKRLELNAPLAEADPNTFYGGDEKGYTDYPFLNEAEAA